jgi:hypothetical protein
MQYRTRQEIYDIVKTHAQLQPYRSRNPGNTHCAYRGETGSKCFVGALIPDEKYNPNFDERCDTSIDTYSNADIREAAGISDNDRNFAASLQSIHDCTSAYEWPDALRTFALENGLLA